MNDQPDSQPPLPSSIPPTAGKRSRWLLYGCGGLLALVLVVVATVAITIWWLQRPITPVVLSAPEKAAVEAKLHAVAGGGAPASATASPQPEKDRVYVKGSKVLRITERELNGLLNSNTDLGKSVLLELAKDAINAYVTVPIPADFPVGGGRTFRARARFAVSLGHGGAPSAVIEDVTVLGLSLPKDWLAGLRGENLIEKVTGHRNGSAVLHGIRSLRVEPGAMVIELSD
jgi:hypothetical protein